MPEEIMIIIVTAIVMGTTTVMVVAKMILNHLNRKSGPTGDSSLTQSELRSLIRSAVFEATDPIQEELSSLRRQLGAPAEANLLPGRTGPDDRESDR